MQYFIFALTALLHDDVLYFSNLFLQSFLYYFFKMCKILLCLGEDSEPLIKLKRLLVTMVNFCRDISSEKGDKVSKAVLQLVVSEDRKNVRQSVEW